VKRLWVAWLILSLTLTACNSAEKKHKAECEALAKWANQVGEHMRIAPAPSADKSMDSSQHKAKSRRRHAEGARKASQSAIPFTDEYRKGVALRLLQTYKDQAVGIDHQADGLESDNTKLTEQGIGEEIQALKQQVAISKEWLEKCDKPVQ
jgi:predicted small secreted protein